MHSLLRPPHPRWGSHHLVPKWSPWSPNWSSYFHLFFCPSSPALVNGLWLSPAGNPTSEISPGLQPHLHSKFPREHRSSCENKLLESFLCISHRSPSSLVCICWSPRLGCPVLSFLSYRTPTSLLRHNSSGTSNSVPWSKHRRRQAAPSSGLPRHLVHTFLTTLTTSDGNC